MKRLIALCVLAFSCLCLLSMSRLGAAPPKLQTAANDKAEIQHLIDRWTKAIHDKDIDGIMAVYAPEVVVFDIMPPMQYKGKDAYRSDYVKSLEQFKVPIETEIRELSITTGDSIAFSHSIQRLNGTLKTGEKTDLWVRFTDCYRKINGKWLVVHEHISVPTDFESGKAVLDLKP